MRLAELQEGEGMKEEKRLSSVPSKALFDGRYTLADVRAMLYDPDAETPWHDMLPSFQRLLVEWLFMQLESHTSNNALHVQPGREAGGL